MTELSPEEKLRRVIEAQVKGGYERWSFISNVEGGIEFVLPATGTVLQIILDTEGCKAAYGEEEESIYDIDNYATDAPKYYVPCVEILKAWHSGDHGNDWQSALDVAYSLLPDE